MSAFSTEEIVESFKFLPRYNLDRLLLVCRQWNQLIKRFERQLCVRRLSVHIYSKETTVEIQPTKVIRAVHHIRLMKPAAKSFKYSHLEKQVIFPEGPHKALFSFLDSHIRNSVVSLSLMGVMPLGLMCLIKDLIKGQIQRNCSIISIYHHGSRSVLNPEISLSELLKVSFLSASKSFSLIQPIRETNEVGPYMKLVDHCTIVCSIANRLRKPIPRLAITWQFNHNFPEHLIEIFKNSGKGDWPEHIVVTPVGKIRPAPLRAKIQNKKPDIKDLSVLENRAQSILEYIWPNAKELCPDLRDRPMEIVHLNAQDDRRLTIEFTMNPDRNSDYICSFIFKTVRLSPDFVKYVDIFRRTF
ncbi:hypothetical protein Ddc_16125 [Ditylenchus destructor]|nr:hypothetical protein Ddc_16125 [Ditylenchus destructor]